MNPFLQNLELGRFSFWFGFLAGILFTWLVSRMYTRIPQIKVMFQERLQATRLRLSLSAKGRYLRDLYNHVQHLHLASPFFALDEIVVTPHILYPPLQVEPGVEMVDEDITSATIPYLPDHPEMATVFGAHRMALPEALQGGASLILSGKPGSGKSTALAYLCAMVASGEGKSLDPSRYLPVLVHASELHAGQLPDKPAHEILAEAIAVHIPNLSMQSLSSLLEAELISRQVLLLVDGLDETVPEILQEIATFLRSINSQYPGIRIVAATSLEFYDGLTTLGMLPVAMAAWDSHQKSEFIERWSRLWQQKIAPTHQAAGEEIDPLLLEGWLLASEIPPTPLELTLKAWAAYAGDAIGPGFMDCLEAYLRRCLATLGPGSPEKTQKARRLLTLLSWEMIRETRNSFDKKTLEKRFGDFEDPISRLVENGFLYPRTPTRLAPSHLVMMAYLASFHPEAKESFGELINQPAWDGKTLILYFLMAKGRVTALPSGWIESKEDPLHRNLLLAGNGLRQVGQGMVWRTEVMRQLVAIVRQPSNPLGLRARALMGLINSGDAGLPTLFSQWLGSNQYELRFLGALGLGMVGDIKSVDDLAQLLNNPILKVSRAAGLALAAIGSKAALEALVNALLRGSEGQRRTAAESLAKHTAEGHPVLLEGSQVEDVLIRRAVVFGLKSVKDAWARQTLEKMQLEDREWAVRSLASEAIDELSSLPRQIPKPDPQLAETPWLIAFAASLGMGVTYGKPAVELLMRAFREGDEDQRLAATRRLGLMGETSILPDLYQMLNGNLVELKEVAYETLNHFVSMGNPISTARQVDTSYSIKLETGG